MKKRFSILLGYGILLTAISFYFAGCDTTDTSDPDPPDIVDTLSTDQAKVEIRAANQQITLAMEEIMNAEAFVTLNFLSELMGAEVPLKSNPLPLIREVEEHKIRAYREMIVEKYGPAGEPDLDEGGIWKYNYNTHEFELIDPNVPYLRLIFPADENDYNQGGTNAELTLSNYQYVIIDDDGYEEVLPTRFDIELKLYGDLAIRVLYTASFDAEGIPQSMAIDVDMPPYSSSMSQSESASTMSSHMELKKNNDIILSYSMTGTLTPDHDVETATGHLQITPLRLQGHMNQAAMENCDYLDVDCMNENMDIKVVLTTHNALIGHVELRLFTNEWDETEAVPVVVYEDGSWELLDDIFDIDFEL